MDKIVEALLYSFVVYVVYSLAFAKMPIALGKEIVHGKEIFFVEGRATALVGLFAISLFLGVGISYMTNRDWVFTLLRKMRATQRTATGYVWGDVFLRYSGYVLVELVDRRLVFGWVHYYPDTSEEGDLFLEDAAWVGRDGQQTPIPGAGILITRHSGIRTISFVDHKGPLEDIHQPGSDTGA